jgi:hypothetical protein
VESKPVRKKGSLAEEIPRPFIAKEKVTKLHTSASPSMSICSHITTLDTPRKKNHMRFASTSVNIKFNYSGHYPSSSLVFKHDVSETEPCRRLQVEPEALSIGPN